jgi:hypothetical protein
MSVTYNFVNSDSVNRALEQGATFIRSFVYQDANGDAIDLSDYTARMQVRVDYTSDQKIIELTTQNAGITLGGVDGTILLQLSATDTAGLPSGNYVYDLEVESLSGIVTRLIEGRFDITPEVTR